MIRQNILSHLIFYKEAPVITQPFHPFKHDLWLWFRGISCSWISFLFSVITVSRIQKLPCTAFLQKLKEQWLEKCRKDACHFCACVFVKCREVPVVVSCLRQVGWRLMKQAAAVFWWTIKANDMNLNADSSCLHLKFNYFNINLFLCSMDPFQL